MPNWVPFLQWGIPILLTVLNLILLVLNLRFTRQQWKTNRQDQFDLRFYDKRRAIFDAVMEFLAGAVAKGHITQADLRKFSQGTREAPQLYDDKINGIIQNLYKEGVGEMHWYSMIMMYNVTSPEYKYLTDASGKRMKWFNELVDSLPKQFDPYLKIKKYQWKKIE